MQHPRAQMALIRLAAQGKDDAKFILELMEACEKWLEGVKDLETVLGIDPDVEDVLNGYMDDAYEQFLPPLLKRSGKLEYFQFHIPSILNIEARFRFEKSMTGQAPKTLWVNYHCVHALQFAMGLRFDGEDVELVYLKKDPKTGRKLGTNGYDLLAIWTPNDFPGGAPPYDCVATMEELEGDKEEGD